MVTKRLDMLTFKRVYRISFIVCSSKYYKINKVDNCEVRDDFESYIVRHDKSRIVVNGMPLFIDIVKEEFKDKESALKEASRLIELNLKEDMNIDDLNIFNNTLNKDIK